MPILFKNGYRSAKIFLATDKMQLHLLRSVFSVLISYLLYYSLKSIPLVNALLLANAAPLIVPFIGYWFFAQKINHRLWLPVLIGYVGVALILNPDKNIFHSGALFAFGSAIALSFTIQCVRRLSITDSITTINAYFLIFSTLISGIIAIPFWESISNQILLIMFVIGFLYFTSQFLANAAMKYANPQLISSLMYLNVFYATVISFLLWNTFPSALTLIGMLLIVIGGIFCIYVEHKTLHTEKEVIDLQYSA